MAYKKNTFIVPYGSLTAVAVFIFAFLYFKDGIFNQEVGMVSQDLVMPRGKTPRPTSTTVPEALTAASPLKSHVKFLMMDKPLTSDAVQMAMDNIMRERFKLPPRTLPQEYATWIASLPTSHVNAVVTMLENTDPEEWEKKLSSVRSMDESDREVYLFKSVKPCDTADCLV